MTAYLALSRPARYDLLARLVGARDAQWPLVAQAGIEPGATVLEIGTGTGAVALLAKSAVPEATVAGIDPDAESLAAARRKAAQAGQDVRFDEGSAEHLPHEDGSVDRVLSSFMFHHIPAGQKVPVLREVRRVLAPGGRLHLLDFDSGFPQPAGWLFRLGRRGHQHGGEHGHGHGDEAVDVPALMREAGFSGVDVVARGRSRLGGHTFYRAER